MFIHMQTKYGRGEQVQGEGGQSEPINQLLI